VAIGEPGITVGGEDVVEVAESFERDVEDGDVGTETGGHLGGVDPHHPAADDHDLGRRHTWNPAEQDSPAAIDLLEILGAGLHRHSARDLRHRREEGQLAARELDRLIRDGDRAGLDHGPGEPFVGGEMEVGVQHLARAHSRPLAFDGLLHLDDEVGGRPDLLGPGHDAGPGQGVGLVVEPAAFAGSPLDRHRVSLGDERLDAGRHESDAVFAGLDLFGDADVHGALSRKQRER
jgi:hypothetical protein